MSNPSRSMSASSGSSSPFNKSPGLAHLFKVKEIWDEYVSEVFERSEHRLNLEQFTKFVHTILEREEQDVELDKKVKGVFEKLDLNKDGFISFFEFTRIVQADGRILIRGINA